MSVSTAAGAMTELEIKGRAFAKVLKDLGIAGGSFDQYPQAMQRFLLFMHDATDFGKEEVRKTTAEIARACGRCERWVYKAIRQCLDHIENGEAAPLIVKRFVKGGREVAGRILALNVKFAEPKKEDKDKEKSKARPARKPKPAATYGTANPAPDAPPDPEWEAHKAALAAKREEEARAEAEPEAEADPTLDPEYWLKRGPELAAKREAEEERRKARAGGGPQPMPSSGRHSQEELNAQMEVVRRMQAARKAASGPAPEAPGPAPEAPDPKPRE